MHLPGDPDCGGGDHVGIVAVLLEVTQDLQHRPGDTVHVRKEGLRDDRYSHSLRMTERRGRTRRKRPAAPDVHRMLDGGSPAMRSLVPRSLSAGTVGDVTTDLLAESLTGP